jgi:hypothetical protein
VRYLAVSCNGIVALGGISHEIAFPTPMPDLTK